METVEFLPEQQLVLYKHYLIETGITNDLIALRSGKTDTTGYYFIDLEKQIYAKYDAFSEDAKELEHGKLSAKSVGLDLSEKGDLFDNASDLKITDTLIHNEHLKIATAVKKDTSQTYRLKAWIKAQPENFPVQISKFLSVKTGNGFVDKVQYSAPDPIIGTLIWSLQYKESKLPGSTIRLMEKWNARLTNMR